MVDRQVPRRNTAPKETQEDAPSNSAETYGRPGCFCVSHWQLPKALGEFQSDLTKDCPPGFHLCRTRRPLGTGMRATLAWVSKVWPEHEAPKPEPSARGCSILSAPPPPAHSRGPGAAREHAPTCGHQLLYLAVVAYDDEGLLCLSQAGWEEQDLGRKGLSCSLPGRGFFPITPSSRPHPLPRASPPGRLPGVQPRLRDMRRQFTGMEIKMALKQHV